MARIPLPMVRSKPAPIQAVLDLMTNSLAVLYERRDQAMETVARAVEHVRGDVACESLFQLLEELRQFLLGAFMEFHEEETLGVRHTTAFADHVKAIHRHFVVAA